MSHIFEALVQGPPGPIWLFRYDALCREFQKSCKELGLDKTVPSQLRHSRPSWDRLRQYRSAAEVQKQADGQARHLW